jgi:hypothetical protein
MGCPICVRHDKALHHGSHYADAPDRSSLTALIWECNSYFSVVVRERAFAFDRSSFRLYLGPYVSIDGQSFLQMERVHATDPHNVPVASSIASHCDSDMHLAVLKAWMDECTQHHPHCQNLAWHHVGTPLPTRLIELRPSKDSCLVLARHLNHISSVRYATLSHRWRDAAGMPRLLRGNILELQRGISMDSLPKVFRDAMEICPRLGIHYLWIDALCLIQDDAADCEKEIANMGNIYTNAYINLGATGAASNPERGLRYRSEQDGMWPFHVPVHRQGHEINYLAYRAQTTRVPGSEELMLRGWVLQERMLSPRSVYFDDILSWECHGMLANEIFPRGVPWLRGRRPHWGRDQPLKISRLLSMKDSMVNIDHKTAELHARWLHVCKHFSRCTLTYEADAFPAISGLAKAFGRALDDLYIAGFWWQNLVPGLLWYVERSYEPNKHYQDRTHSDDYIGKSCLRIRWI